MKTPAIRIKPAPAPVYSGVKKGSNHFVTTLLRILAIFSGFQKKPKFNKIHWE